MRITPERRRVLTRAIPRAAREYHGSWHGEQWRVAGNSLTWRGRRTRVASEVEMGQSVVGAVAGLSVLVAVGCGTSTSRRSGVAVTSSPGTVTVASPGG